MRPHWLCKKYHVLMFVAVSLLFARVASRNPRGPTLMTRKRPAVDVAGAIFSSTASKMVSRDCSPTAREAVGNGGEGNDNATTNDGSAAGSDGQQLPTAVRYLPTPDKSFSDHKQYRSILLANGLHALLISDPTEKPITGNKASRSSRAGDGGGGGEDAGGNTNNRTSNSISSATSSDAEESSQDGGNTSDGDDDEDEEVVTDDDDGANQSNAGDSEEGEKLAAAALCVGVGSFSDPRNVQGLAHFLEHMIFMGSKKFPQENEYDSYISKCGGFDNAVTDLEETTFYFEIDDEHLEGALDRFASLFTEPLMLRDSICRERDAVESEFQTNKNRFSSRREQLLASLGRDDHPCSLFSWGNLETLKDNITDDELYKALHQFQQRHYSAHRMHFAVQARMSLDELEALTVRYFSAIPCNGLPAEDLTATYSERNAFRDEFYNKLFVVKPISDVSQLDITWCLPPSVKDYHVKPVDYISYVMGFEGKNSLTSYLRRNSLALDVQTGASYGFEKNSLYTLFCVSITLTDHGLDNIDEILRAVYAFVRLLQREGPSERLFYELQELEANSFRYRKEKEASDNVEELVVNMRYYPPKDIITGSELYFRYDAAEIQRVIDDLNEGRFNLMISATKPYRNVSYDQTERWFGTEYTALEMPEEWKSLWETAQPMEEIKLQEKNQYISTNFTILADEEGKAEIPPYPEQIFNDDIGELWFRQDAKFRLPLALMYFHIISPLTFNDPRSSALTGFFASMIKFQIAEDLYPAEVAGLNYELYSAEKGLLLKVDGYNEKLPIIVDEITAAMGRFSEKVNEGVFDVIKVKLEKAYYNELMKPNKLNRDARLKVVQQNHWTTWEKFEYLKKLTPDDIRQFAREFFAGVKLQVLVQGNLEPETARQVMKTVMQNFNGSAIADPKSIEMRAKQIPVGDHYLRIRNFRETDVNTVTTTFYQAGPVTPELNACLELLISLLEEPLFDILRTKEQLGYDVSTTLRDNYGILGYSITVHSQENKFNYNHIDQRIELFNRHFIDILRNMSSEDFGLVKMSLMHRKLVVDTELKNEASRNWGEITTEEYIFNRNKLELERIQQLTKEDVIALYDQLVLNSTSRRKLCVQVVGNPDKATTDSPAATSDGGEVRHDFQPIYLPHDETVVGDQIGQRRYIENIEQFSSTLMLYPVTKVDFGRQK
ncbi:nardilysin-like isoform X1 [Anopheles albimanus]|uniref:nardilysin-like isoform X1 n=2 Tax=Anopheles albimanus TaxID=7167 RepID=UPI001640D629|nr:nardilysin-like isoform X1 [Anopheles albimanus]